MISPPPPPAPSGPRLGFLHTAPVHVPVFGALVDEIDPSASVVTLVDEALLARARAGSTDAELAEGVRLSLTRLVRDGAEVVVCTCSTIGALAEQVGHEDGLPVLRVDRPMADRAVRTPPARQGDPVRVLVAVALGSTLGPTTALLSASAAAADCAIEVEVLRCDDAWPLFEDGRSDAFAAAVAASVRAALTPAGATTSRADVVVLAQASMAPAAGLLSDLAVPVLASPREAVLRALDVAATTHATEPTPRAVSG